MLRIKNWMVSPIIEKSLIYDMETSTCTYIKVFLDFSYYLGCSPFRLKLDIDCKYIIETSWLRKFYVALATFLASFWILAEFRSDIFSESLTKTPVYYINILIIISSTYHKWSTVVNFWTKNQIYCKILNTLQEHQRTLFSFKSKKRFSDKSIALMICASYTFIIALQTLSGKGLIVGSNQSNTDLVTYWSASRWWTGMIITGRYNFFLSSNATCCSSLDQAIGVFSLIGYVSRRVFALYCDLLDLMCILTLWTVTKEFYLSLKQSQFELVPEIRLIQSSVNALVGSGSGILFTSHHGKEILKKFELLKQLAHLINKGLGANLCAWVVETVLYYSLYFDAVLIEKANNANLLRVFFLFFYFGNACAILLYSAKIPYKMKMLKRWLSFEENRRHLDRDQVALLISEVDDNMVSIKANNIYPLTYSTVANILSIILTNFIVCLQF